MCFFYDGSKILFRIAFALFKLNEKQLFNATDTAQLLLVCKQLHTIVEDAETLLNCAYEFPVSTNRLQEMRKEVKKEFKKI